MTSTTALRSGEVARAAGVNQQTLRYYERRGLLPEPCRSPGGHRVYGPEAVTTLRIIKAAQRLGFTLDEVADLQTIRSRLVAALDAGCDDLAACAAQEGCPIPFSELARPISC